MLDNVHNQTCPASVTAQFERLLDYVEEKLAAVDIHLDQRGRTGLHQLPQGRVVPDLVEQT